jgi:Tfp pilus assembly protein PilO
MFKSFKQRITSELNTRGVPRGAAFWLQAMAATLLLLNLIALYFYFAPPGGSRSELTAQSAQIHRQVVTSRFAAQRLETVSNKVQLAETQTTTFESKYFLAGREAYRKMFSDLEKLTLEAGIQQRDGVFTEEPIEGSTDLTLLNLSVNLDGTYSDLMHFLNGVDHAPSLLILDSLNAAPQQGTERLNLAVKFLTIMREAPAGAPIPTTASPAAAATPARVAPEPAATSTSAPAPVPTTTKASPAAGAKP